MAVEVADQSLYLDETFGPYMIGETEKVPVPGLNFYVPMVGAVGGMLEIKMNGNVEALTVTIGIDACMSVFGYEKCGADITSELPYWIMNDSINFSHFCSAQQNFRN